MEESSRDVKDIGVYDVMVCSKQESSRGVKDMGCMSLWCGSCC